MFWVYLTRADPRASRHGDPCTGIVDRVGSATSRRFVSKIWFLVEARLWRGHGLLFWTEQSCWLTHQAHQLCSPSWKTQPHVLSFENHCFLRSDRLSPPPPPSPFLSLSVSITLTVVKTRLRPQMTTWVPSPDVKKRSLTQRETDSAEARYLRMKCCVR